MAVVDVIIVTWNASALIDGVLDALDRQTVAPRQVLVVDNDSADAGALPDIVARHPRCRLLALDSNTGFAAANNTGIAQCGGADFIALLNPDAFPEPEWLEALLRAAHAYPACGSFASRMLDYHDERRLDGTGDMLTLSGKPWRRGCGKPASGQFTQPEQVFAACAAAALYVKADLDACAGFDESFFCYVEDVDLGFRLQLAGRPCRYVPDAVVRHMGSALTGRRSDFSVYYGQRNLVLNYFKNMPMALLVLLLPVHLLMNIAYLVGGMLLGRGAVMWRAKRDAARMLPQVLRARRRIQSDRRVSSIDIWRMLTLWTR